MKSFIIALFLCGCCLPLLANDEVDVLEVERDCREFCFENTGMEAHTIEKNNKCSCSYLSDGEPATQVDDVLEEDVEAIDNTADAESVLIEGLESTPDSSIDNSLNPGE